MKYWNALYYSIGYFILSAIFGVLMVIFYSFLAKNNSKLQKHEKKRKFAKEREKNLEYLQDIFNKVSVEKNPCFLSNFVV